MRHFVNNMFVIANTMLLVLGLVVAPHAGAKAFTTSYEAAQWHRSVEHRTTLSIER